MVVLSAPLTWCMLTCLPHRRASLAMAELKPMHYDCQHGSGRHCNGSNDCRAVLALLPVECSLCALCSCCPMVLAWIVALHKAQAPAMWRTWRPTGQRSLLASPPLMQSRPLMARR